MIRPDETDQWERIRKHFPEEHVPGGRAGRKPIPTRHVLEAVLWILNTRAQWHMLPQSYPNYKTVHQTLSNLVLQRDLASGYDETLPTGAFATKARWMKKNASSMRRSLWPKVAGRKSDQRERGKGMKIMAIVDRHRLPLSVSTHAANRSRSPLRAAMLRAST